MPRGVVGTCKQTALEVYLIMSGEETLPAFTGSRGVGISAEQAEPTLAAAQPPTQLRVT